ncbi:hypothetical protein SteCoe_4316 [Stentor coeruleus]|uniref:Uncharacterized protein n=1 Tax=Stentor coeruleus TaxID=5963 RepID=A0A1R2CV65_9CILI|nr:hypothetical protein SteCoe_4316 [Stentor coeruleus]
MADQIFVPELGLISGKSQNLSMRMWYPQVGITYKPNKPYIKNKKKRSPINPGHHLGHLRLTSHNPKKVSSLPSDPFSFFNNYTVFPSKPTKKLDNKLPKTALEIDLQPRPLTIGNYKNIFYEDLNNDEKDKYKDNELNKALNIGLLSRPITISRPKRQKLSYNSNNNYELGTEVYVNLPTLQPRPYKINSEYF